MQNKRQQIGEKGESLAAWYLKKSGYKIIEQNYRTPLGEIDIIAKEKKTIVFVEVKSRQSVRYGNPKWAVRPAILKIDPADGCQGQIRCRRHYF
jgi:putative endonuclease